MDNWEVRIVILRRPPGPLYAHLLLGCQWLVGLLGMASYATVHPDGSVADDGYLNAVYDAMADSNP